MPGGPVITPRRFTMNSWRFPPQTQEVQMDEKWGFVYKKEKHCDPDEPADRRCGDNWDHVAYDSEHRLVLSTVPGKRSAAKVAALVNDVHRRLNGRVPRLITTDEYAPYKQAILNTFGDEVTPPRTGKPGRPRASCKIAPAGLNYATVHKKREKGRIIDITFNVVFGTAASVASALAASAVSKQINPPMADVHRTTQRHPPRRTIATAVRSVRPTASAKIGTPTKRWATLLSTAITSAGRCGR